MNNNIVYDKVSVDDASVVELAKRAGSTPAAVASMINGQRYRKAYNAAKNASVKELKVRVAALQEELAKKEVK
jgi:hypothetical protein